MIYFMSTILITSMIPIFTTSYLECDSICKQNQHICRPNYLLMFRSNCKITSCSMKKVNDIERIEYCFECLNNYYYDDNHNEIYEDITEYFCDTFLVEDLINQNNGISFFDKKNRYFVDKIIMNSNRIVKTNMKIDFKPNKNFD